MAWTTPRTWVASEVVSASIMNTHVRDNLAAIGDARTSFSPAWTAATVNPAIGNGTIQGFYSQSGKHVEGNIVITCGSTTTYGTGAYSFSLPVTAASAFRLHPCTGWLNGLNIACVGRGALSTTIALYNTATHAAIGSTTGLANTHRIEIGFVYEAA